MTYDTQTNEQEGRLGQVGQEEGGGCGESEKGPRGESGHQIGYCQKCGERLSTHPRYARATAKHKYCSQSCARKKEPTKYTVDAWWGTVKAGEAWIADYYPKFPEWVDPWKREIKSCIQKNKYKNDELERKRSSQKSKEWRAIKIQTIPNYRSIELKRNKDWQRRNPEKAKAACRKSLQKRKANDPLFKIQCNMRTRLKSIMKSIRKWELHRQMGRLGCSASDFKAHLESKFKKGMTWENYGTYWHVDHIIPVTHFNHADMKQVAQCWHYTNLQPLRAMENIIKGSRMGNPQMSLLI